MARGVLNNLVPSTASALGIARAIIHGLFLFSVLNTSFSDIGKLPATVLRPAGAMRLLPWHFYESLLTPECMSLLKWLMVCSLLLSTIGFLTPLTTKTSAALVLFNEGLLRSLGNFRHDEMSAVYALAVLAFTPCGDAFSVDCWRKSKEPHASGFRYGYPILLMQLILAWSYFSSAIIKLRVAGLGYFTPDNLPSLAIYLSLGNLRPTEFKLAFLLPRFREYLPFLVGVTIAWEFFFPLAVFWRRARWWILGFGIIFHALSLFLLNVFFPFHLGLYLLFVDWDKVSSRMSESKLLGRVNSRARRWLYSPRKRN